MSPCVVHPKLSSVITYRLEITGARAIHHQRFVPAAEQMPKELVSPVEAPGMDTPKPFHPRHQVGLGRFDDQMEVIGHQTPCMHLPTGALTALPQDFDERLPIGIIVEDRLAPVAPAHKW